MKKDDMRKLIKDFLIDMSPYIIAGVADFISKKSNEKTIDVEEVEEIETPPVKKRKRKTTK